MFQFVGAIVIEDNGNDIETDLLPNTMLDDIGIGEFAVNGAFFEVDSLLRISEETGSAGLNLDKHPKTFGMGDDIQLVAAEAPVGFNNGVAVVEQILLRHGLALFT